MELTERETLVKVEQQLQNAIENQSQIVEDMREIFGRIESDSKALSAVKGELQTHLETSAVQRDNCSDKIDNNNNKVSELSEKIKSINNNVDVSLGELKKILKKEEESREKIEKDYKIFKESLKTSLKNIKMLFGFIAALLAIISPYLTLIIKEALSK